MTASAGPARALSPIFAGLVVLANLAAAALGLAMQAGRFSERLDVINQFAPFAAAAAGLCLAAALLTRRGPLRNVALLCGVVAVLLSSATMAREAARAVQPHTPANGAATLKVVQFNLWAANIDLQPTLDWILAQKADVIVIEEGEGNSRWISRQLRKRYPGWSSCNLPAAGGVMIFSRLPASDKWSTGMPRAAWARYRWRGRLVTVVGAHFEHPYPAGLQQRQSRRLAAMIQQEPTEYAILAGDFNSTPWSFSLKDQDRAYGLERRTRALWSWPARYVIGGERRLAPLPLLPIDHIYAGRGWRTVKVERGPRLGSDHYPVVVELALR